MNLVPFREAMSNGRVDYAEIILNVLIFVPLGIYAGLLWRNLTVGSKILLFSSLPVLRLKQYNMFLG